MWRCACLTALRDHGADLQAKTNQGSTPLDYAKGVFATFERDEAGLVQARIDAVFPPISNAKGEVPIAAERVTFIACGSGSRLPVRYRVLMVPRSTVPTRHLSC